MMDADAHFMVQVQRGELRAFEELVKKHQGPLYGYFVRLGNSTADAEDLVQETFLRAFRGRRTFDPQRPFSPWLYGIASHVWADYGRQRARVPDAAALVGQGLQQPEATEVSDLVEQSVQHDQARRVQDALQQLPEEHRTVLLLRHYHGLRYVDISQALGVSVGTVKSRVHYALAKLRDGLQAQDLGET